MVTAIVEKAAELNAAKSRMLQEQVAMSIGINRDQRKRQQSSH
jgi:hypothetical protein